MATIAERLKQLDSVDDTGLMMGYRFLATPRRKMAGDKVVLKKASAKKSRTYASFRKSAAKPVRKAS